MNSLFKRALVWTAAFFIWICFSAWIFVQVEYSDVDEYEQKYQLLHSLYNSMAYKFNITIEEFNNFSKTAHEALSVPKLQWSYSTSFDFVFQTVTTIGYGYITPQTSKGKILCIFVALFGIPITMLALKSIGELIVVCVNSSITNLEKKILRRQEAKKVQVKSAVVLFSLMVIFLMVFALLLVNSTDMTLVQCVYFWFVTYTTIGFGDYVPGKIPQSIQRLSFNSSAYHDNKPTKSLQEFDVPVYVTIFYLLFCMLGFCVVSSVLNSIVAALEVEGHRPWCSWCNSRNIQNHDDGNQLSAVHSDMGVANLNKESSRSVNENVISLSFTETTKD